MSIHNNNKPPRLVEITGDSSESLVEEQPTQVDYQRKEDMSNRHVKEYIQWCEENAPDDLPVEYRKELITRVKWGMFTREKLPFFVKAYNAGNWQEDKELHEELYSLYVGVMAGIMMKEDSISFFNDDIEELGKPKAPDTQPTNEPIPESSETLTGEYIPGSTNERVDNLLDRALDDAERVEVSNTTVYTGGGGGGGGGSEWGVAEYALAGVAVAAAGYALYKGVEFLTSNDDIVVISGDIR